MGAACAIRKERVCAALVSAGFLLVIGVDHIAATIVWFAVIGMGAANIVPQLVSFAGIAVFCLVVAFTAWKILKPQIN